MTHFPPSQLDVIKLVALGMHNVEIASVLEIKPSAVHMRLRRAGRHAGIAGRLGLVAQACRWGQMQDLPLQSTADPSALLPHLDLLRCFTAGLTSKQIGRRLHLSRPGVDARTRRLRAAIGARNRAHAVLIAWQMRVPPEVGR